MELSNYNIDDIDRIIEDEKLIHTIKKMLSKGIYPIKFYRGLNILNWKSNDYFYAYLQREDGMFIGTSEKTRR